MIIAHEVGYNHHHVGWVGGGLGVGWGWVGNGLQPAKRVVVHGLGGGGGTRKKLKKIKKKL